MTPDPSFPPASNLAGSPCDFDAVLERRDTGCAKWSFNERLFGAADVISMWVADMDFPSPPPVVEAIRRRAEHPIYGYPMRSPAFYEPLVDWLRSRHGWETDRAWFVHSPGVVPALGLAVLAYTQPGDKVIIQPPVYYPFFNVVKNNGRQVVENPLVVQDGVYRMDLAALDRLIDARTKLLILCSPHNPVGRVWTRSELAALGDLCLKRNITVISDEIHSDLVFPWARHTPLASLSPELAQITATCFAPSKTFNLAGLATSAVVIPNPRLRQSFTTVVENLGLQLGNVFGQVGLEAAYRYGAEWLAGLMAYLEGNLDYLTEFLARRLPQIKPNRPEGTYLAWLDCRALGLDRAALKDLFLKQARVALDDGPIFGTGGEGFQRLNFACPRATLDAALRRIEQAVLALG